MIQTLAKWLVRLLWFVWLLAMLLVGLKLATDNTEQVSVTLFGWQSPEASLGLVICLCLLTGVVLGWLASTGPYFRERQRRKRLAKQLGQTKSEVSTLRTAPMKS